MSLALVVATYRADDSVLRLLETAHRVATPPWHHIFVVDSLGSGRIANTIAERGWRDTSYRSADTNLGSAGNLSARLRWAAEAGFDYAYALNHDGNLSAPHVRALLESAERRVAAGAKLGAIYPLRQYTKRGGKYDLTGTSRLPRPFRGTRSRPTAPFRVTAASSNGALYALAAIRDGLGPWADFWMGWEDHAYGWQLDDHGYEQWVETEVVFNDGYEAKPLAGKLHINDKPAWYAYYQTRNLLLATQRTNQSFTAKCLLVPRFALELGLTVTVRTEKRKRLRLLAMGVRDGLIGVTGKGPVP